MLQLLLASLCHLTVGLLQKEATLNAEITSQNGASVHRNTQTVTISESTDYHINVGLQEDDYDLKLSLDNSWCFEPSIESTLTLTLNGNTPYPQKDTDFLFVFSVNNWQYFSFFVHLDSTNNIKSRIYPSISLPDITSSVSDWISNTNIHSRWDRISNNGSWLFPPNGWNKQAIWPLQFVIFNDPIHNQIIFQFYHNITHQYGTGYIFDGVFVPNTPIDIYIMADSNGEEYIVSALNIQSSKTTPNPTYIPSISPSYYPSNIPSISPSNPPSISPTYLATKSPTKNVLFDIDYRIIITITFGDKLSSDNAHKIVSIVDEITNKMVNNSCANSTEIQKQRHSTFAAITVINITIFVCNEFAEIHNVSHLQQQLIQNIKQSELQIVGINETDIDVVICDQTPPTHTTFYVATSNYYEADEEEKDDLIANANESAVNVNAMLWIIKLIALQLLMCCLMSVCVFIIKCKTKRLTSKKKQISEKCNEILERDDSLHSQGNDTNIDEYDISLTNTEMSQMTNVPNQTPDFLQVRSNSNVCTNILQILQADVIEHYDGHIPQTSETVMKIQRHDHELALRQLKEAHEIISDNGRSDGIPEIPPTIHTVTATITTFTDIISPTLTFSLPRYIKTKRRRGLV